ncbi:MULTISPECIES: ATP-binding cassette domain-containing protein [unclassified Mesorhizobium]|uniref:ATP-binding cassette domain-containing protein n=1 Tax=unclassified Mesorhizobium TaxID=325217 RepID=UPI00241536D4|nr:MULTISPECIES: ATP-binding cassette domain-containing protein [unclassified Mesorhizobium]MDG4889980.1 ATP-binding cassette domain-containing protein [Mesorhizobium sp. WSM4887]MDG4904122.1 ATP-binding cassette domain-containing protein [Mesorhizobium sp. WSM4962]MDG4909149.1 ATP-binding cassette domain-containing protein [Mesorhizobium sp. WSM4898]MDG4921773.1 ATP-binding cassette domain-containing protein [Mesorhizobium sp. WSM4989]
MNSAEVLLDVRNVAKSYGHIEAVKDVSFAVGKGKVLALLGDNGAGKSTLISMLSGVVSPDRGSLHWEGRPIDFRSPQAAQDAGVATLFQNLALVDELSIARNMFLGREDSVTKGWGPFKRLDHAKMRRETEQAAISMGLRLRSADDRISELSGGQRQSIAISCAIHFSAKLIILDEPTAALSVRQQEQVLDTIRAVRDRGISVIFITHNVHHVRPVADDIVVLRNGRSIAAFGIDEADPEHVSALIRGNEEPRRH